METYLIYIAKAALAAGAFYLAFLVLFQNQKQFVFNRLYLPISFALSFLIPLITFTSIKYIEAVPLTDFNGFAYLTDSALAVEQAQFVPVWYHYLFAFYVLGSVLFFFRLIVGHLKAVSMVLKSQIQKLFGIQVHVTPADVHPFSFFSKIVVSEKTLDSPNLRMIVEHENIHVREKHTLDILFSEILFLAQWFNPFAWLLKDAMKNNLEFLTDHQIAQNHNPKEYQLAMVALADKKSVAPFLNALNGNQLKNRIIMMKKKTENKYSILKQLVVLPLLAVLVMGLSNKETKTEFVEPVTQNLANEEVNDLSANKFLISIQFDQEKKIVKIQGINGCAFNELTYTIPDDKTVKIDQFGLNSQMDKDKITANSDLADFQFLIERQNEMFKLTGEKGTNWKELSFKPASKEHFINETGVLFNNPEKEGIISGKVTDEKGVPIKGASVIVKGTTTGTITDISGNYELQVNNKNEILSFLVPDFETVNIDINEQSIVDVQLKSDNLTKDNGVKVTTSGTKYFTLEKVDKYIVSGKVTNEKDEPISGVSVVDKGKLTGTITDTKGNYEIKSERRIETLIFGKDGYEMVEINVNDRENLDVKLEVDNKLYIVDGKEFKDKMSEIDTDNIKSIDILKGESGTKLYGKKGKNGVVLITTKNAAKNNSFEIKDTVKVVGYGSTSKRRSIDETNGEFDFGSFKNVPPSGNPLVIVDGQTYKSVDDANVQPDEIASISVLKYESASTKIYGEQAKNGVIIINTKTKYNSEKAEPLIDEKAIEKYDEKRKNAVVETILKNDDTSKEIESIYDMRKLIAWQIKYPVAAQENRIEDTFEIYAFINNAGQIERITEKNPDGKYVNIDEVVVTGLGPKTIGNSINKEDGKKLLQEETKRVLGKLPNVKVPELSGKMVAFRFKFVLE